LCFCAVGSWQAAKEAKGASGERGEFLLAFEDVLEIREPLKYPKMLSYNFVGHA